MIINTKESIITTMNNSVHIPNELIDFVNRETYSLLIKGNAGTGKTTLALTILRALNINKNCLYISTRISPEQLFKYYPWLQSFFGESKKSQLDEISEIEPDVPFFVDARLDEPSSLFERITNQLMDIKAPMIVIDSWDAIGYFMDKEALMNNARVLQTWRERSKAKMIFITENIKDTTFDFLVDGIVELQQKYYDSRRVREIFLLKLRGVMIDRPSYIFTLNNNFFRSYESYNPANYLITNSITDKKPESVLQTFDNGYIKTGYKELDRVLGDGLAKKSLVNVELDSNINAKIALAFLAKIISNFTAVGNPVLLQPFEGIESEYLSRYLNSSLSKNARGVMEISQFASKAKNTPDYSTRVLKHSDNTKRLEFIQKSILKIQKKYPKKPLLAIMGLDLSHELHTDVSELVKQQIEFIKSRADLFIIVTRNSQNNVQENLSEISDVCLEISEINGTLFLKSKIPWSHLYAIVTDRNFGYPHITLEPIV
jgi:KaiC/GvpD/RAD55 family RecA-like ATPase